MSPFDVNKIGGTMQPAHEKSPAGASRSVINHLVSVSS